MRPLELRGVKGAIRGMIHEAPAKRVAVILGGQLAANRIGPNRLYWQIACRLESDGWNVVRVDLSGLGESDAALEDVRYQDHVMELAQVCEWCISEGFDLPRLVAHCAGCFTAVDCGDARPDLVAGILMLAPFVRNPTSLSRLLPDPDAWREIRDVGFTYRKGVYFHRSFAEASRTLATGRRASPHQGSIKLVILPEFDELSPLSASLKWVSAMGIRHEVIPSSDHNFTSSKPREQLLETVSREMESWK